MAKRRDGFACVKCGGKHRLEVDHIAPVRDAPERSFDLENLQTLCGPCHGAKTRKEANLCEVGPERIKWRELLQSTRPN
ncbi:HNH endonuclease [Erythrobacter fulvus]|uniref:HNH endonuclease n=1 Tax=Erythrobacter fulvus TaxID=2987523 RepID=UPI0035ABEF09